MPTRPKKIETEKSKDQQSYFWIIPVGFMLVLIAYGIYYVSINAPS